MEKNPFFSDKTVATLEILGYTVSKIQDYALIFMEVL